jgi:hypothetical protein
MAKDSGLTAVERRALDALAVAWNEFVCLPVEHPDDQLEFRQAIHRAQNIVLSRPTRRAMADRRG